MQIMYANHEKVLSDWKTLPIAITVSGSHIWNMDHPNSDIDLCLIYLIDPITQIIRKTKKCRAYKIYGNDVSAYELSHVIEQLKRGNITAYTQVLSPYTIDSNGKVKKIEDLELNDSFRELREIARKNLSKISYQSIFGLAKKNLELYFSIRMKQNNEFEYVSSRAATKVHVTEEKIREVLGLNHTFPLIFLENSSPVIPKFTKNHQNFRKKINIIGRVLKFGINLFKDKEIRFEKTEFTEISQIVSLFAELNGWMEKSDLPETINVEVYDAFYENELVKRCIGVIKEKYFEYLL